MLQGNLDMPAQNTATLQDTFLAHLRDHRAEVTMFLVNGIRLQGYVRSVDRFVVELVRGNSSQLVYKHAISAINPAEAIHLFDPNAEG
jgi:host factor-I protein